MKTLSTLLLVALTIFAQGCGYGSKAVTPPASGTKPTITQLTPDNVNAGNAAFTLTVNGTSFASNATVDWNGAAQATTFVTASQLTAAIPATAVATSGTVSITVTNPAVSGGTYGGGTTAATSAGMDFTVN
jgi:hypothetical protein